METVATRLFTFTPPNTSPTHRSRTDLSTSSALYPTFSAYSFPRRLQQSRWSVAPPSRLRQLARSSVTAGLTSKQMELSSSKTVGVDDLLIVGPGVLGRIVAEKWREGHPGCQIFGQTVTTDHHNELVAMGIQPSIKGTTIDEQYANIIYCAPPSRTPDYAVDLREAVLKWNGEGSFLFTSSSAPYDCFDNGSCDENSPVVPLGKSPRTDVLLKAEAVVLEYGGCVLRLAGLYKDGRGAHTYWLEKGTIEARPDHILNLIHYEASSSKPFPFVLPPNFSLLGQIVDIPHLLSFQIRKGGSSWFCIGQFLSQDAASLAVTIMKKKLRGGIFLGCDNHPLSRQEVMDIVEKSGKFSKKFQGFTGTSDPLGKRLNNSKTRAELGWEPKYPSFAHFLGVAE